MSDTHLSDISFSHLHLPESLARGIADADAVCSRLKQGLSQVQMGARSESPDSVFERLGG